MGYAFVVNPCLWYLTILSRRNIEMFLSISKSCKEPFIFQQFNWTKWKCCRRVWVLYTYKYTWVVQSNSQNNKGTWIFLLVLFDIELRSWLSYPELGITSTTNMSIGKLLCNCLICKSHKQKWPEVIFLSWFRQCTESGSIYFFLLLDLLFMICIWYL